MIAVGVVGVVENGPHPGLRVRVVDDSANSGGFFIFQWWPGSDGPNADGAFDDWVESRAQLEAYWRETGWQVRWDARPIQKAPRPTETLVIEQGVGTDRRQVMDTRIPAHRTEATLQQDGTLTLEHLPFRAGQAVEVIILPRSDAARSAELYPLRGTPYRYERPTEPVAEEDWEALQ